MPADLVLPEWPELTPCERLHQYRLWLETVWLPEIKRLAGSEPESEHPRLTLIQGGEGDNAA